jgi:hypothetical protein
MAGWIGLHFPAYPPAWNLVRADWCRRLGEGGTLAGPDAVELLDRPERWVREHADGYVAPHKTVEGKATPWEQWLAETLGMAQQLPLRMPDRDPNSGR